MTQDKASSDGNRASYQKAAGSNYYALLGLHPSASVREIRQTYRELSKIYHPDTTTLPHAIATEKFQQLNEAYATLSNPDRRTNYDQKIGYSRVVVSQPLPSLNKPQPKTSSAYLDATDRPLSAGELFALFILGVTFVACLVLAVTIGVTKGEATFKPILVQPVIQEAIQASRNANETSVESNIGSSKPIETPTIDPLKSKATPPIKVQSSPSSNAKPNATIKPTAEPKPALNPAKSFKAPFIPNPNSL